MLKIERRFSTEMRFDAAEKKITGYAALYNSRSEDLGGFLETIRAGAFTRTLASKPDVRALIDHNQSKILGRTLSGTLILTEDSRGLAVTINPPETQYAADLMTVMARGDVTQMSFAFHSAVDSWSVVDGQRMRELVDLDLVDVSVVTYPAYPETSVAVRSMGEWVDRDAAQRRARWLRLAGGKK